MAEALATEFLPAERATPAEVTRQNLLVRSEDLVRKFLDAVPNMTVVLNRQRQIVHANRAFLSFVRAAEPERIIGLRPGEVVGCIRVGSDPGGCGTTRFCRTCGAANAIHDAQCGMVAEEECRITRGEKGAVDALDLRVWASPLEVAEQEFTVFTVADISGEKRRRALERIFFHDVLNTAGGVRGFAEILDGYPHDSAEVTEIAQVLKVSSEQLVTEIEAQRTLASAEQGDLRTEIARIESVSFLRAVKGTALGLDAAFDRDIRIHDRAESVTFESDRTLLARVVGNMAKNALEASKSGDGIVLDARRDGGHIRLSVTNPAVMPEEVRLQVFQRSFTTKGHGRGLGTWSMKLLGEKYLSGEVDFTSDEQAGTTFFIRVPIR